MKQIYALIFTLIPALFLAQTDISSTIAAGLTAYGQSDDFGLGEYQIFLDTDNGVFDKPIILVDGFDPGDSRTVQGLYDLLNYDGPTGNENLADIVRTAGFDVVILNFPGYLRLADNSLLNLSDVTDTNGDMIIDEADFPSGSTFVDGGTDFIERNAMILVELINEVNSQKVGSQENVIIGPSMGGLISRYALNYMEATNGQEHETRLYLSFDAPHLGANVPIGLQHLLNYLAYGLDLSLGNFNVTALQPLIDGFLDSPASRQLLTDHFTAHLAAGEPANFDPTKLTPEAHPWRGIFETNINSFNSSGFPSDTRNVSIINGSGIGSAYFAVGNSGATTSPGFTVLNNLSIPLDVPIGSGSANITTRFTPAASTTITVNDLEVIYCFIGCSDLLGGEGFANGQSFSFSDGIDAAPGGLFDLSGLTEDIAVEPGSITETFLNALLIDKFNFIPSVSGLALEITNGEVDWYHDIDLGPGDPPGMAAQSTTNNTPFVNYYLPDDNEGHVELNEANVTFALTEIMSETLNIESLNEISLRLAKNPINGSLRILNSSPIIDAQMTVTDITGKIVHQMNADLNGDTSFNLNIAKGMYILSIQSNAVTKQIKFLKN
ncbi:MAG: T9SS type A sorting domain-containing protein [bacterium]